MEKSKEEHLKSEILEETKSLLVEPVREAMSEVRQTMSEVRDGFSEQFDRISARLKAIEDYLGSSSKLRYIHVELSHGARLLKDDEIKKVEALADKFDHDDPSTFEQLSESSFLPN